MPIRLGDIVEQRRKDIAPLLSDATLEATLRDRIAARYPEAPLNLGDRLRASDVVSVLAEFKRASPSKGDIATHVDIGTQAAAYSSAGAAVISVLTESHWFKGSLADMEDARAAVSAEATRPLVLRKDFVVDAVQVLEARAYGADTVLLMVSVLHTVAAVEPLINLCRSLGMEPLVEVVSEAEMDVALESGAVVIGINTRDLNTFVVDMSKTPRLVSYAATKCNLKDRGICMLSLSGITSRADVVPFEAIGIRGVLVGEALMRASDPKLLIHSLVTDSGNDPQPPLVKVCGVRDVAAAQVAAQNGAHFIGVIMVPGTRRCVAEGTAAAICSAMQTFREKDPKAALAAAKAFAAAASSPQEWYQSWFKSLNDVARSVRPLVVGVFQNQPAEDVNRIVASAGFDIVQLHGKEGFDFCSTINVPCFKVVHIGAPGSDVTALTSGFKSHTAAAVLMDSKVGGSGVSFDWSIAAAVKARGFPVLLAGGLTPSNVTRALADSQAGGVDVSSGVETDGVKDPAKITAYLSAALSAPAVAPAVTPPPAAASAVAAAPSAALPSAIPMLMRQRTDNEASSPEAATPPLAPPTLNRQSTDIEGTAGTSPSVATMPAPLPPTAATALLGRQHTDIEAAVTPPGSLAANSGAAVDGARRAPAVLPPAVPRLARQVTDVDAPLPPPVAGLARQRTDIEHATGAGQGATPVPTAAPTLGRQETDIEAHVEPAPVYPTPPLLRRQRTDNEQPAKPE